MRLRACLLPLALVTPLLAQQPAAPPQAPQQPPLTTIRARAKLVLIDVVVTGKDHTPLKGLTAKDFTLTEDGKPQPIKQFEEHSSSTPVDTAKLPPMPPGVFTNYTSAPTNAPVNVLLLDSLNTPLSDQQFVRAQILDYIKKAKPGTSIAIFGLTSRLSLLQGFTSDPEILRQAVKITRGKASPLLDDQIGNSGVQSITDQFADIGQVSASLAQFDAVQQSFQLQLRAKYTLDAMSQLGRYLANIPGRKNLIWFSGSFPLDILPDGDLENPFAVVADSEDEYREATNLLARAQVAVYPIDARGLQSPPMFSAAQGGSKYARDPSAFGKDLSNFTTSQANEHSTMFRMAQDTGGRAFVNTNGLSQAVAKAIDAGSNYYTLAYTPTNDKWKGDFRKIKVALAQKGYELAYRRGYYADDPDSPDAAISARQSLTADARKAARPDADAMLQAMVHGLPGATQIIYKVRILPASTTAEPTLPEGNLTGASGFAKVKGPYRRYRIDYAISPADLSFKVNADGTYHLILELVALVYEPDGQVAIAQTNIVNGDITAQKFAALRQGGVPFHQEIAVPETGTYTIRTGIHDVQGNKIGAVELPVSAVSHLPPPPQ